MPGTVPDDRSMPRKLLDDIPSYHVIDVDILVAGSCVYVSLTRAAMKEIVINKTSN